MGCLLCCPRKPKKECDIKQNSVQYKDQKEEKNRRSLKAPSTYQFRNQINHQQNILIEQHQENEAIQQKVAQNQYDDSTDISVVVNQHQENESIQQKVAQKSRGSLKGPSISKSHNQIDHQQICCPRKLKKECDIKQNSVQYKDQKEEKNRSSLKAPSIPQSSNQINHQQYQDQVNNQQKAAQYYRNHSIDVSVVQNTPKSFKQIEQQRERNEKLNAKLVSIIGLKLFDFGTTSNSPVAYIPLHSDAEFFQIYSKISRKDNFIVHKIERIENKYLLNSYLLKAEQKKQQFPQLKEELLFHGTSKNVVDYICTMGFDWRYVKEHKFGKGISFSTNSTYASVYSDECHNKVMLVCKVLVGNCCPGNNRMIIPSDQFDTSLKATPNGGMDRIVTVKFDDGEFYPAYKIYYHLEQPNQRRVRNKIRIK